MEIHHYQGQGFLLDSFQNLRQKLQLSVEGREVLRNGVEGDAVPASYL